MTKGPIRDYLRLKPLAPADGSATAHLYDHRLERLLDRLPPRWQNTLRWLRHPSARWARIPAAVLLIFGGLLSILPILGLWMLPLGLILLAEDIPALHRLRARLLDWLERRRPHWFAPDDSIAAGDRHSAASPMLTRSHRPTADGEVT
jgi:hypothetical protein